MSSWAQAAWIIKRVSEQIPELATLDKVLTDITDVVSNLDMTTLNNTINSLSSAITTLNPSQITSNINSHIDEKIDGTQSIDGINDRLDAIEAKLDTLISNFENVTLLAVDRSDGSEDSDIPT